MNKKYIVAAIVVVAVIGYLLMSGFKESSVYYLEVSELMENPDNFSDRGMRVSGTVIEGTIKKDMANRKLEFEITDEKGAVMLVEYNRIEIPDAFEPGVDVIVEGNYDKAAQRFNANVLLAKCPSKYEAEVEEETKG